MSSIRSILEDAIVDNIPEVDSACLRTAIDQALKEIEELIDGVIMSAISVNQHGQFEDDGGNICWYLDDLEKALRNNLKELLR